MDWFMGEVDDMFSGRELVSLVGLDTAIEQAAVCSKPSVDAIDNGPTVVENVLCPDDDTTSPMLRNNKDRRLRKVKKTDKSTTKDGAGGGNTRKMLLDVEKYVAQAQASSASDEAVDARVRHLMSLGAKAPTRNTVNYKQLQHVRADQRKAEHEARQQFRVHSKFMKTKKTKSTKNKAPEKTKVPFMKNPKQSRKR